MDRRNNSRPRGCRGGFVLLEALVSVAILGFVVMACMRSFTQSLQAARLMEIQTQGLFFAQQLMSEFEILPPVEDVTEGGFGEDYAPYYYTVNLEIVEPDYGRLDCDDHIDKFFDMRQMTIEIWFKDGKMNNPLRIVGVDCAITGFEKFSSATKLSYAMY